MKTALFFFLVGAVAGLIAMGIYVDRHNHPTPTLAGQAQATASRAVEQTKAVAGEVQDSLAAKLTEWHLSGDDIKADLAKSGQVVRRKTAAVGTAMTDARILSVIKAKLVLDRDLSARAIEIDVDHGAVTLNGSVKSLDLIGRAIALSLDTDGVQTVTSHLAVQA
ncbi:MAG: BON domain-containing protein [Opitutales bacterium]